jgi:UDP-N-acetylmuramoylalanine--D-glutamate ligase
MINLDYFKNKKVLIMGLGSHGGGVGVTKFFAKIGANVIVTDLKTEKELKKSLEKLKGYKIRYILGKHREEDFKNADIIIKNPAVPRDSYFLKIAKKNKIPIHTDVSLYFLLSPAFTIGITGTKGKSTTSNFIFNILKKKYNCFLVGVAGKSFLEVLPKLKQKSIVVAEISSWQLESLIYVKKSPQIGVITNIDKDHLNTYKSLFDYQKAKFNIARWQKEDDFLFLNNNLKNLYKKFKKMWNIKSKVIFYKYSKYFEKELKKEGFKFFGKGAVENAKVSFLIGRKFGLKKREILKILSKIKPLFGRLEPIEKFKKLWINDTCSTNPYSTINSILAFNKKIVLITGGTDKNLDFENLAKIIQKRVKLLILLKGSATEKLKKELKKLKIDEYFETDNLKEAMIFANQKSKPKDIILFSPAAASFELFKDEFDRGRKFKKYLTTD